LLLVLDDFEQLLQESAGVRPVRARHASLLATILRAFDPAASDSRLLITSRFPFRLAEGTEDLAGRLARIELSSFDETAERKLMLRQQAAAQELALSDLAAREALLSRARAAAHGNPGLQDLLIARLVLNAAVPLAEAEAALAQMERYLSGGELPQSEQLRELLENIAVQALLGLAGSAGQVLLQAMRLFELPVPIGVAERLAIEMGGDVQSLIDLALLEPGTDPVQPEQSAVRISPLAASRVPLPEAAEQSRLAAIATGPLFAAWGGEASGRPAVADLQLTRLALAAEEAPIAAVCGARAIRALETDSYTSAAQLGRDLLSLLRNAAHPAPWALLANAARVIGAA
jgi:hypothetical protein